MINNGKISIIVPMYNCAEFAPKCIENILSQSYKNWELWLVLGDSNDGTEAVCQKYEDKDSRIHNIFHIDGLVPARNVGYEHATGDWIMYIDGDDWIDGDCLVEIMEAAKRYDNPDVVFWKFVQDMDGKIIEGKWSFDTGEKEHLYEGEGCKELTCYGIDYTSGIGESYAKIARMDYVRSHNLHQNKNLRQGMEGYEYSLRLYYQAERILYLNKYFYHYRYNPNSLSKVISESNAKNLHESAVEIKKYVDSLPDDKYTTVIRQKMNKRCVYALLAAVMSTYFHPNNKLNYVEKKKRFKTAMMNFIVFKEALDNVSLSDFDLKRRVAVFSIRHNLYFMLAIIAKVKQYMDSRGHYGY